MEQAKHRILLVAGTRPEAIKMIPVYLALRERNQLFAPILCVTGQHRHLLDQVLSAFGVEPDIDLALMRPGADLNDMTATILAAMKSVLQQIEPDLMLVHGDTTTALASTLAAFYAGIQVGHVEAGLRTHDLQAPFPEEFNRRVTGMVARHHFAPTDSARDNLLRELVPLDHIVVTGNTVIDALRIVRTRTETDLAIGAALDAQLDAALRFDWRSTPYVLFTGHRRENFGQGLQEICTAIATLSDRLPHVHFVCVLHHNPAAREPCREILAERDNVHLVEPMPYDLFLHALRHCHHVLTDSGGIQEEAPSLDKPVLLARDVTERPEGVRAGATHLVGSDREAIVSGVSALFADPSLHKRMATAQKPYGDGFAADRIADYLARMMP